MNTPTIGIIGATGKTGLRVLNKFKTLGINTRGLSRHSQHAFDWNKPEEWRQALTDLDSLYVTYHPDLAIPKAAADINALVTIAEQCKVKHIVLLSGRGEPGAQHAERIVQNCGLSWNVVRASWFMQNFSENFMLDGILERRLILPESKAREPFIDVDDIVDMVIACLSRDDLHNRLFEVTGPELLSFSDCITSIQNSINEPITYQAIPINAYLKAAIDNGMPDDLAWLINELFTEVLDGRNEWISNTVEEILGRPAGTFQNYVNGVDRTGTWKALNHKKAL